MPKGIFELEQDLEGIRNQLLELETSPRIKGRLERAAKEIRDAQSTLIFAQIIQAQENLEEKNA